MFGVVGRVKGSEAFQGGSQNIRVAHGRNEVRVECLGFVSVAEQKDFFPRGDVDFSLFATGGLEKSDNCSG
jgi:hypothetical protein